MFLKVTIILCVLNIAVCATVSPQSSPEEYEVLEETYDFIVVGGGSAGAALVNRLAKDGTYTVLLIEKGGDPDIIAEVPALAAVMYTTKNADKYFIEKQPDVGLGLEDQQMVWIKGKGLGGTSLMNYMVATRGDSEYYDRWSELNPGWSFQDVLPFFKDLENAKVADVNKTIRGTDGEVDITENSERSEAAKAFVEGCKEYGMKFLRDYNAEKLFGVGYVQANIRDGKRCHTDKAFLRDVKSNVQIERNSLASRIVIDPETYTAQGVEFLRDTKTYYATAKKEVILSAGTLASPQILMLSGIGPKEDLEKLGIDVINDLPVGKVIYDHVIYPGLVFKLNESITPDFHDLVDPENWIRFLKDGTGLLSIPALAIEALGFVKTPLNNETSDYADVEYIFLSGSFNSDHGLFMKEEWRVSDKSFDILWEPFLGEPVWSVLPMLFRPESRGYMELRSKDPKERPKFYGNYFTDQNKQDMKTMIAAIRIIQGIAKTPALARYQSELHLAALPGCEKHETDSDEFWECMIRHIGTGVWHQTSSCKMGPITDPEAVVDNELRVYGMKNVRVADLSVLPVPFTGHPNIPAMMIGAKAADLILKTYPK